MGEYVVVDIAGFITGPKAPSSDKGLFVPIDPKRLLDTRLGAVGTEFQAPVVQPQQQVAPQREAPVQAAKPGRGRNARSENYYDIKTTIFNAQKLASKATLYLACKVLLEKCANLPVAKFSAMNRMAFKQISNATML